MRKINFLKFTLDLLMGIIFLLVFNSKFLHVHGIHEIIGVIIGAAVVVHMILNIKWIKNMTLAVFNKKMAVRARLVYFLNIITFIDMIIIIISGLAISKFLFPNLGIYNGLFNERTHITSAFIGLALIGIHLGLHWKWVINVFKNIVGVNGESKAFGYAAKLIAVVILVFGLYSIVSINYVSKITLAFKSVPKHELKETAAKAPKPNEGMKDNIKHKTGLVREKGVNGNIISGVAQDMSIIGVFLVVLYYSEKALLKRKLKASI
ncbi:DUF4405 domain-containing protein [Clostridium felsineum]|uniref:Flavinylation-associated cytochrome domain-containing protein n=1 Tax=Clostridium felsineum TaxID=36839 RepID=A0A1S8KWZ9_9CLOT|nr:DUF4405 domain-containing protein [Clostridium felsineum]URZ07018.1 hypothetical protein CLROS_023510 [Clostridium felsineum]URZ12048.1 hypothetical protein CROST_027650 [Clostridium felsineum]